jgi:hypothetical protein
MMKMTPWQNYSVIRAICHRELKQKEGATGTTPMFRQVILLCASN